MSSFVTPGQHSRSKFVQGMCVLYFALATACLVWPIYPWLGNRIEPRVMGLPFSLVWILAIISSNFVVLLVLYRLRLVDAEEFETNSPDGGSR